MEQEVVNCLFCHEDVVSGEQFNRVENQLKVDRKCIDEFIWNCGRFSVKWVDRGTKRDALPLCYQCKDAYQCMVQLESQVKELEELVQNFESVLRKRVASGNGRRDLKKRRGPPPRDKKDFLPMVENKLPARETKSRESPADSDLSPLSSVSNPTTDDLSVHQVKVECEPSYPVPDTLEDHPPIEWSDSPDSPGPLEPEEDPLQETEQPEQSENEDNLEEDQESSEYSPDDTSDDDYLAPSSSRRRSSTAKRGRASSSSTRRKSSSKPKRKPVDPIIYPKRSERLYTCHICSKEVIGLTQFIAHYKTDHPGHERYTCIYCPRRFNSVAACLGHQCTHTKEKVFKCKLCPASYGYETGLRTHMKTEHPPGGQPGFPCPKCDKRFPRRIILTNHLVAVHDEKPAAVVSKKAQACLVCDKVLLGRGAFMQHYAEEHPDERRYTCKFCGRHYVEYGHCLLHQRSHTGERPFVCSTCGKTFPAQNWLNTHMKYVHEGAPRAPKEEHPCEQCEKTFNSKTELALHMNLHKGTMLVCTSCGRAFTHERTFEKHNTLIHEGQAVHTGRIDDLRPETLEKLGVQIDPKGVKKCHICWEPILANGLLQKHFDDNHPDHPGGPMTCRCGKVFKTYRELQTHARVVHTEEKNFHCEECPASFHFLAQLNQHKKIKHSPLEERMTHICATCGAGFLTVATLNKHRKEVHDETPLRYVCECCGKDYADKKGLHVHRNQEHLKIHPYKCTEEGCEKSYAAKGDYDKHMRSHSGEKSFKCDHCDKRFMHATSKKRHIMEVHEGKRANYRDRERKRRRQESESGDESSVDVGGGQMMMGHFLH